MVPVVAVKKDVLPRHAWQAASGRETGTRRMHAPENGLATYGSLSIKEREELGARIVEKAAAAKARPPSRAEIDMWTARLLEENARLGNHSC